MTYGDRRLRKFQLRGSHWQRPSARADDRARPFRPRLDDGLRQPDLGRHAEPLVDEAPLAQEVAVAPGVRRQEPAARRVVHDRPDPRREQLLEPLPAIAQPPRQPPPGQQVRQPGLGPLAVAGPVAPRRKGGEQPPVRPAAEDDVSVRNGEDVLPERVVRPGLVQRRQVGLVARACEGRVGGGRRRRHGSRRRRGGNQLRGRRGLLVRLGAQRAALPLRTRGEHAEQRQQRRRPSGHCPATGPRWLPEAAWLTAIGSDYTDFFRIAQVPDIARILTPRRSVSRRPTRSPPSRGRARPWPPASRPPPRAAAPE